MSSRVGQKPPKPPKTPSPHFQISAMTRREGWEEDSEEFTTRRRGGRGMRVDASKGSRLSDLLRDRFKVEISRNGQVLSWKVKLNHG